MRESDSHDPMKIKAEKIRELIAALNQVIEAALQEEKQHEALLGTVDDMYSKSARNLVHYTAFRKFDLRSTQKKLRNLGLTRFANAEGHVLASLTNTRHILQNLIRDDGDVALKSHLSIKKGKRLLAKNTKALLGYRSKGRRVRIMVTQPTAAAYDYQMVLQMVKNGMNCARVNCAHDTPEVWLKIIENVRRAAKASGKNVKIAMDLAGPKIRTGRITPGPKIRKFTPEKDVTGNIVQPAEIVLVPRIDEFSLPNTLAVAPNDLAKLDLNDTFTFTDTRDKTRKLKIIALNDNEAIAHCYETSYIGTGTELHSTNQPLEKIIVGELPPIEQALILRKGDVFTVVKEDVEGIPALIDEDGKVIQKALISCQLPEVFDDITSGDRILFDDGKIEGVITEVGKSAFDVRITLAKEKGSRLKAEKGMNFPNTNLGISGLTKKDRKDLAFVAKHADIVNFSFVNSKRDVEELHEELKKHGAFNILDVILKIETKFAVDNLSSILLAAMRSKFIGVMIARGDLAVETGWDTIGRVQEEILLLCGAAHVPVVWATQVLENLAKKGLPSRSEITDTMAALQAECIMLNKGPYINRAIVLLNTILSDMEENHDKKEIMLPKMERLLKSEK
ncbi:pyruvate kinase [Flavobacteriaceae bacterium 3-367]